MWLASHCLGNVFLFSTTSRQFLWPTQTAPGIFAASLPELVKNKMKFLKELKNYETDFLPHVY
jgi:hypothetical protein